MRGVQAGKDKAQIEQFEADHIEWFANKKLYKGIKPKYENHTWVIYKRKKYCGTRSRLSDADEFSKCKVM